MHLVGYFEENEGMVGAKLPQKGEEFWRYIFLSSSKLYKNNEAEIKKILLDKGNDKPLFFYSKFIGLAI